MKVQWKTSVTYVYVDALLMYLCICIVCIHMWVNTYLNAVLDSAYINQYTWYEKKNSIIQYLFNKRGEISPIDKNRCITKYFFPNIYAPLHTVCKTVCTV